MSCYPSVSGSGVGPRLNNFLPWIHRMFSPLTIFDRGTESSAEHCSTRRFHQPSVHLFQIPCDHRSCLKITNVCSCQESVQKAVLRFHFVHLPDLRRVLQRKPAIVRAVTSGDSVVLIDVETKVTNAPPKEVNLTLQSLRAPSLGRRVMKNGKASYEKDEPFAFQSREFLRKLLVGKSVVYTEAHSAGSRSYGEVWLHEENLRYKIVEEGWADISIKGFSFFFVVPRLWCSPT